MNSGRANKLFGKPMPEKKTGKHALLCDAAEFLESDEDIVAYFNAALEYGDPSVVSVALGYKLDLSAFS